VRLRIALIVLALVVAPAVAFAVSKNHPAQAPVVGWTAYVAPASSGGAANTKAEQAAIRTDVANWETSHPGGSCTISDPDSAQCQTADGLPVDFVAIVSTTVTPSGAP
jgi:hypothetical protein